MKPIAHPMLKLTLALLLIAATTACAAFAQLPAFTTPAPKPLGPDPIYIGFPSVEYERNAIPGSALFLHDGHTVAFLETLDPVIYFVDTHDASLTATLPIQGLTPLGSLAATPDGKQLLCASRNSQLYFIDLDHRSNPPILLDLTDACPDHEIVETGPLLISPDGSTAAIGGTLRHHEYPEKFPTDRTRIYDGQRGTLTLVDILHRKILTHIDAGNYGFHQLAFSPDGKHLAATSIAPDVYPAGSSPPPIQSFLIDLPSAKLISSIKHPEPEMPSLHFTSDSSTLVLTFFPHNYKSQTPYIADTFSATDGSPLNFIPLPPPSDQHPAAFGNSAPWSSPPVLPGLQLCENFRASIFPAYMDPPILSPDHSRLVRFTYSGGFALEIRDASRPDSTVVSLALIPSHRPARKAYDLHATPPPAPPAAPFAADIEWFKYIVLPKSNFIYWDSSKNARPFMGFNLHESGMPGPSPKEIEHQHRPDLIAAVLPNPLPEP